ncbi:MAG TPA: hypothetical protein VFO76_06455 [Candidatus Kapabacteria bacterium]|nr:hypothetical protein [Candidatus Kapabacteria bacterium]
MLAVRTLQEESRPENKLIRLISAVVLLLSLSFLTSVGSAQDFSDIDNEHPIRLDGSISISGNKYSVAGAPARRPATGWTIIGTPTLDIYGLSLPFTIILSDQESSFRQPFDQFGVSPQYKWATLHLGYRSLTYSKYTLAGITFLGGGIDLNPQPLRLSAMYGRFQRAVAEDTTNVSVQPAYYRTGFAGRIGYGSDQNFFDLIYLHAKDDSASLSHPPTQITLFPEENSIIGLNTKLAIVEQVILDGEVAASVLTRDIRSPVIDSNQVPKSLQWLIDSKTSTSLLLASTAGLTIRLSHFSVRVGYERIEPDYTSLGAYYYTTDIENYTVAPSFDMFQNKVRVSGSFGIQNDNILNTKLATTQRVIGSGNLSINPTQSFGLDLNYANYSTQQGPIPAQTSFNDSVRVSSVAQSASVTPRLLLISSESVQSIIISGSYQDYTDQNLFTQKYANSKTTSGTANYNVTFTKTALSLGASILVAQTEQAASATGLKGVTVNGSKTLLDNRLTLGGSFGFTQSTIKPHDSLLAALGNTTTNTLSQSINSSYRVSDQGTFSFTLYATENSSSQATVPDFVEILATLTYTHNFSF